jgi:serine/threonine-protein kinase PknG
MDAVVIGEVPESKRSCSECMRGLTRQAGYCPDCGQSYSFLPVLRPGQVVAGKFEVKGTLAFGGQGWIYLAMDTILNRWVVLKGLLNSHDLALHQAAAKESEYLAAVNHRNIVSIYDFIKEGEHGFIVMEYVNGKSLLELRRDGPMMASHACGYLLELLPAFGYLHEMGLLYCDFKMDNAIAVGDTVKLIDLGAVRQSASSDDYVYATRGYAAPEADDPSPASDLYALGRTLAILIADFDFQGSMARSLPNADSVEALQRHPSLHRFLCKATRDDPAARFHSAADMAAQLQGVLRDITAGTDELAPFPSVVFEGETGRGAAGVELGADVDQRAPQMWALPALRIVESDPAAIEVESATKLHDANERLAYLTQIASGNPDSIEIPLRLADAHLEVGSTDSDVERWLGRAVNVDSAGWRATWYRGVMALRADDGAAAIRAFDAVLDEVPGELAPKLALAYAHEQANDLNEAAAQYALVSMADPSYVSAAFGLSRCLRAKGDREGAVRALECVQRVSSQYERARLAMVLALTDDRHSRPTLPELGRAADILADLGRRETISFHRAAANLYEAAAKLVAAGQVSDEPLVIVLDVPMRADALRAAAAKELMACAWLTTSRADRVRFVDEANRARPLTLY